MLYKNKCDIIYNYCSCWIRYIYRIFDDWRNPPCPECGIKKSN